MVLIGLFATTWVRRPAPLLVYNPSASAPIGFYRVLPAYRLKRGDLVLAHTPASVRGLADARGYLPASVPLIKRIAAMDGDVVCSADGVIAINGHPLARQLRTDKLGRALPTWAGCRHLRQDEIFLLMANVPASFDGRYFGPITVQSVIGRLAPLDWP